MSDETISFDLEDPQWFTEEVNKLTLNFMLQVSGVLNALELEIDDLSTSGFEESLLDKLIRDVKAISLDRINEKIEKLLS